MSKEPAASGRWCLPATVRDNRDSVGRRGRLQNRESRYRVVGRPSAARQNRLDSLARRRQAGCRQCRPRTCAVLSNSPIGTVFDASGLHHDLGQRKSEAQPLFVSVAGRSVLRFDGKDDCLERSGLNVRLSAATIFLVAAPRSNSGGYRAFISGNQTGHNDYLTGFNVDLGETASRRFETLNLEGKGFSGTVNVLKQPREFGEFHVIQIVMPPGSAAIATIVDDLPQEPRRRRAQTLAIDELTIGARCYSNDPRPVSLQSFLHGDVAEVLIYDRALTESERTAVAGYLKAKHQGLTALLNATAEQLGLRSPEDRQRSAGRPDARSWVCRQGAAPRPAEHQQHSLPVGRHARGAGLQWKRLSPQRSGWRWTGGPRRAFLGESRPAPRRSEWR